MKNKTRKLGFPLVAILFILGLLTVLLPQSIMVFAANENDEHEHINANAQYDCGHDHDHDYDHVHVDYDLLEGYTGPGYSIEEIYLQANGILIQPMNATVSNVKTCNSITSSHGTGRQDGYATNFLSTGCSNWRGYSYTYGSTDIPFFINTADMTTTRIADIRAQVEMWNQAVMHDGTGQIANLYEVTHTNNINGRPVVVVSQSSSLGSGIAGLFTGSKTAPTVQVATSMNIDTPVHEFGHLLGLDDIDTAAGSSSGTHKVLMGYSRGTTTSTLSSAIKYQDIQGIARVNGRHTSHQFNRYVKNGSNYVHFCFYCDTVDSTSSAKSGSAEMANASTCIHDYQQMVSHGERHWLKCTKCYKVIESEFKVKGLTSTTLEVTGLINTNKTSVTIPSSIGGQAVTSIGGSAFSGNTTMSQISIPASVTSIAPTAFNGRDDLQIVTLNKMGGSGGHSYVVGTDGEYLQNAEAPTHGSLRFDGYYTNTKGRGTQYYDYNMIGIKTYDITTSVTLYAKWSATIFFDKQGGTNGSSYEIATYGAEMPTATAPTKAGYTFCGYYIYNASNGINERYYDSKMHTTRTYGFTGNITLVAKWLPDLPTHLADHDVYEVNNYIRINPTLHWLPYNFVVYSPGGGMYSLYAGIRYMSEISIFALGTSGLELCYEFNDYGSIYATITLEAGVYYLFEFNCYDDYGFYIMELTKT